jgi:sulfur transfer protein SufE
MKQVITVVFNSKSADPKAQGTVEFRGYSDAAVREGFLIFEWDDRMEAYNISTIDTYVVTSE